ncbi:MAG: NADH-quinone oxidoreductase subunit J [Opitutae bacterium]|nr:NADH-quinone oxidoreductase subunit J [Opitutae bacterium]
MIFLLSALLSPGEDTLSFGQSWTVINNSTAPAPVDALVFSTDISAFGYALMTKYMLPVQISGFLLLAAMIGVIILSKRSGTPSSNS